MTADVADSLAAAVADNATWCDIVCTSHDLHPSQDERIWSVARRPPVGYPDAATLTRGVDPAEILRRIDDAPGCSVKDSFADVDLAPHGLEILFTACWIVRRSPGDRPPPTLEQLGWERVAEPAVLAGWASAHGMVEAFRPSLLPRADVAVLGRRIADRFVAGAIALDHEERVGLSNVFCRTDDPAADYAAAADAALACFPRHLVVGYESGQFLEHALAAGFSAAGPLRVWRKP